MPSFAFWNTGPNKIESAIADLLYFHELDLLITTEANSDPNKVVWLANRKKNVDVPYVHFTGIASDRFRIFTRLGNQFYGIRSEDERYIVLKLNLPLLPPMLLMALHAPSPSSHWTKEAIGEEVRLMAEDLRAIESEDKITNSIVAGDFNLNPFDAGIVKATSFHAISDRLEAKKAKRTIQRRDYDYFYNPMWNLLGDTTPGPPASHYYRGSSIIEQQWHLYDQVILRPSLINHLHPGSPFFVSDINGLSLLDRQGRPAKRVFSDHLPVYFKLT